MLFLCFAICLILYVTFFSNSLQLFCSLVNRNRLSKKPFIDDGRYRKFQRKRWDSGINNNFKKKVNKEGPSNELIPEIIKKKKNLKKV